jgi:hypothetical protein
MTRAIQSRYALCFQSQAGSADQLTRAITRFNIELTLLVNGITYKNSILDIGIMFPDSRLPSLRSTEQAHVFDRLHSDK